MADQLPLIHKIIVIIIDILSLWLGVLVYSNNPKSKINRNFSLMTVFLFLWVTFGYLSQVAFANDDNLNLFFSRINIIAVCIFMIPFYFFAENFPSEGKGRRLLGKFMVVFWSVLAFFTFFSNLVVAAVINGEFIYGDVLGNIFLLSTLSVVLFELASIFKRTKRLQGLEQRKIKYIFWGLLIWFIFNVVFNIVSPLIYDSMKYASFGDYSAIFFLGFAAYAIVKEQLFGVKVILTYVMVVSITTLLAVDLFVFTATPTLQIMKFITLLIFLYFGRSLIGSVMKEIELREQLQNLNLHLQEKVDEQTVEIRKSYEVEKKARIELQELDKSKSEFILTAQHHLRTPLTIVKGYIQAVLTGSLGPLTEKISDALSKADNASDRLMSLVNEFLDISQMEVGKSILNLQLSNIRSLVKDIIEELKPDIEKNHITVTYPQDEESYPSIFMDPKKLKEALTVFVDNATKYNSKENGRITIIAKIITHPIERDKKIYQIIIENTGIGIKSDELPKLFTHYFERGEEAKKLYATGRGLGLNIAKSIINAHQGTVRAESEGEGKGARFIIELPME
jgi:signal transduction histidine kinase